MHTFGWLVMLRAYRRCVVLVLDKGKAHIEEVEYEETTLTIETVSDGQTRPWQTMLMQPRSSMQEVTVQVDLMMACLLPGGVYELQSGAGATGLHVEGMGRGAAEADGDKLKRP